MKNIFYIFLISMICLITGCSPIYQTSYSYAPPHSKVGVMCISQCLQSKSMCEQMCQMKNENCRSHAREQAFYDYQNYRDQQIKLNQPVEKSLNDFDHSNWQCETSCDCETGYNTCYQSCGGAVLEHKVCTAFCDKA